MKMINVYIYMKTRTFEIEAASRGLNQKLAHCTCQWPPRQGTEQAPGSSTYLLRELLMYCIARCTCSNRSYQAISLYRDMIYVSICLNRSYQAISMHNL